MPQAQQQANTLRTGSACEQVAFNKAIEEFVKNGLEISGEDEFISTRQMMDAFSEKSGFEGISDTLFTRVLKEYMQEIIGTVGHSRQGSTRGYTGLRLK